MQPRSKGPAPSGSDPPNEIPGREEVSRRLLLSVERTAQGHGGTWLVTGPPGIGKTFLLHWLAGRMRERGFRVWERSFLERRGEIMGPLPEILSILAPPRPGSSPAEASPPSALLPARFLLDLLRALLRTSAQRPVAILLDDAQYADPEAFLAFQLLSRAMGGMRAMLVLAVADPVTEAGPGVDTRWARSVEVLRGEGSLEQLSLHGLDLPTSRAVVESSLKASLEGAEGEEVLSALWGRTEGNPLFLRELASLLLSQGQVQVEGNRVRFAPDGAGPRSSPIGGGWGRMPLPPTLRRLLLDRLDRVLPSELTLLQGAALVGSPFDAEPLAAVTSRTLRDVESHFRDFTSTGLLRQDPESDGVPRWRFSNDLVWEVLLRDAEPDDVRELSRRLALWWSSARPEEVETIARLFHDAGAVDEGLPWVREAIDRALRAQATLSAERHFQWYFDLLAGIPQAPAIRAREALDLVDRLLVRRLRPETVQVLRSLARAQPTEEMRWETGWREVHVLVSFDLPRAERKYEELRAMLERSPLPSDTARMGALGFVHSELLGARLSWSEATVEAENALRLWGDRASVWARGRLHYELGWDHLMLGDFARAREHLIDLLALTAGSEVPVLRATALVLDGSLSLMEGRLAASSRAYQEAGHRLLEVGAMEGYGIARNNRAEVLIHLGRDEEARRELQEAELVGTRFGYPRVVQGCALKWAWLYALRADWGAASDALSTVEAELRTSEISDELWEARLLRLWVDGEMREPGAALDRLHSTFKEDSHLQPHVRPYLSRIEGRLLELSGRPGAREALGRSLEAARRYRGNEEQAAALQAIARWERTHGDLTAAEQAEREADALFPATLPAPDRPSLPH